MRSVAIVGGGAAGMGAAHKLLRAGCSVTLFEARDQVGGHCFGVGVPLPHGGAVRVDGGVSDFHQLTCPAVATLLRELGVESSPAVTDASVMTRDGHTVWSDRQGEGRLRWKVRGMVDGMVDGGAQRLSVTGGLHRYCESFARWFASAGGRLLCSHRVVSAERERYGVRLRAMDPDGRLRIFHAADVVLAVVPGRALGLLRHTTAAERMLAAGFESQSVRVVTHRDARLMPRDRESWAAHNFVAQSPGGDSYRPTMTTHLNRHTGLSAEVPDVFVTWNPHLEPDTERVLDDRELVYTKAGPAARETSQMVEHIQGRRRTWFCGSYLQAPFQHEQDLASGFEVADRILSGNSAAFDRRVEPAPLAAVA